MKGIVAELHNNYMIVITQKGDFVRQRKQAGCNIGDEVTINTVNINKYMRQISAMAASLILIAMLITGAYAYYSPYSYISVDINPSLGLSINRFERVIAVKALNEDAEKLLKSSGGINNKNLNTAVSKILETAYDSGYLKDNEENSVMFTVSTENESKQLKITEEINKVSSEELSKLSSNYTIILEKVEVEDYKKAVTENISPGKVILIEKIKEAKPGIQIEEVKQMSVKQVLDVIKDTKKEEKKHDKDAKKQEEKSQQDKDNKKEDKKDQDKKNDHKNIDSSNNGNGKGNDNKADDSKKEDKKEDKNKDKEVSNPSEGKKTDSEDVKENKQNNNSNSKDNKDNNKDEKGNKESKDNKSSSSSDNSSKGNNNNNKKK